MNEDRAAFYNLIRILNLGAVRCMYKQKKYNLGDMVEVLEYHNGKYGAPGMPRMKKKKATQEQIRKINQSNKERRCWRKMKLNFKENDYWVTLTYRKTERPSNMKKAKNDIRNVFTKLRREYKKHGQELKWMLHTEIGSRGGVHHHLVINRIKDADVAIRKAWTKGGVHIDLLYEEGGFRKLAEYLSKTPNSENKLEESSYSCSRNLKTPIPEVKVYKRKTWKGEPKPPKGYYVEKETYYAGINPVTGYPYRRYILIKIPKINRRI